MERTESLQKTAVLDLERLDTVDKLPTSAVVTELVTLLGAKLTAAIGDCTSTRLVREWSAGNRQPQRDASLRTALKAARAISDVDSPAVAQGWFIGTNRYFNQVSPLEMLRTNDPDGRTGVVRAAISFAGL